MKLDDAISAFRAGKLEIDFTEITFRQVTDEDPSVFTGPGTLKQTLDGTFDVMCSAQASSVRAIVRKMGKDLSVLAGRLYREDDYYEFSGRDTDGFFWTGGKSLLGGSLSVPEKTGAAKAKLRSLSRCDPGDQSEHVLRFLFAEQDKRHWTALLGNERLIALRSTPFSFKLKASVDGDNAIAIAVRSSQPFPQEFEQRLLEALQFLLGSALQPIVTEVPYGPDNKVTLRPPGRQLRGDLLPPPVNMSDDLFAREADELLRCYLDHVYLTAQDGIAAPCSSFLGLIRNAGSSIESWPVSVCIAVEGVAKLIEFSPISMKSEHDRLRGEVKIWMSEKEFSEELSTRVSGMLVGLDEIRPIERMMSLAPVGRLLASDVIVWRKLRNQAVHTREVKPSDFGDDAFQKKLDRIHTVTRLLYSIIFHLIDYRGKITDYGTPGFPTRDYPFEPVPDEPKS